MQVECNVGGIERYARIGIGSGLIAAGLLLPMKRRWMGIAAETLGIISTTTGLAEYCPVSRLMGRNTCHAKEAESAASFPGE